MAKITDQEYGALVEKLATEIIENAITEKEAAEAEVDNGEGQEKEAGVIANAAGKVSDAAQAVAKKAGKIAGKPTKTKSQILAEKAKEAKEFIAKHKDEMVGATAAGAVGYNMGRTRGEKRADEEDENMEVVAAEDVLAVIEKAATVFEDAQFLKQAAEEVLAEAQLYEDAVAQIFKEAGLLSDEDFADDVEESAE